MGLPLSLNFRGTTNFPGVSDAAGETVVPSGEEASGTAGSQYDGVYSVSGVPMGWISNIQTGHFDRSSVPPAKFAGFACATDASARTFRIDLPNGQYDLAFAGGSFTPLGWNPFNLVFQDGAGATLFTLTTTPPSGGDSFCDHTNTLRNSVGWSNANPVRITITTGFLQITCAANFGGALSHLEISTAVIPISGQELAPYIDSVQTGSTNWGNNPGWYLTFTRTARMRQTGLLTSFRLYVHAIGFTTAFYLRIWRRVGFANSFTLIGSSENLKAAINTATGVRTITLANPIAVQDGDFMGYSFDNANTSVLFATQDAEGTYYMPGDPSTPLADPFAWQSQNFTTGINLHLPSFANTIRPQFIALGDGLLTGYPASFSLVEGTNSDPYTPTLTVPYKLAQGWGNMRYQNLSIANRDLRTTSDRVFLDVINRTDTPSYVLISGGHQDLILGRDASYMNISYGVFLSAFSANGWTPIILQITPWTGGTTAQMTLRDSFNANLIAQRANGGYFSSVLIDANATLGQFRSGGPAGNTWDLKAIYDAGDGRHLNDAGSTALANAIQAQLVALGVIPSTPKLPTPEAATPHLVDRVPSMTVVVSAREASPPVGIVTVPLALTDTLALGLTDPAASAIVPTIPVLQRAGAPLPVMRTVSNSKRPITITTLAQLTAYVNRTGDTLGPGGVNSGGPTLGDDVAIAITTLTMSVRLELTPPIGTQTGNDYVTFRSANLSSLPPDGTRVTRADAVNMPRFNLAAGQLGAFITMEGANHYRFVGLNITSADDVLTGIGLLFQSPTSNEDASGHPNYIHVERCLVHGCPVQDPGGCSGGVGGIGAHHSVIDSIIYDIGRSDSPNGGQERHAVTWTGGTGPYLLHNNEIICDGIGVFLGDSNVHNPGIHPANITITNNHFYLPASWCHSEFLYDSQAQGGTCTISADGLTITLTIVPLAAWADGSLGNVQWILNEANNIGQLFLEVHTITAVNIGTKTLTLATPSSYLVGTSGKQFRISQYEGRARRNFTFKNFIESKDANHVLIEGNVLVGAYQGQQAQAITCASVHGDEAGGFDLVVRNNYIAGCCNAINLLWRPFTGEKTQWDSQVFDAMPSGPRAGLVRVTTSNGHLVQTGDTAVITVPAGGGGCVEADGAWPITVESPTQFTINVPFQHPSNNTEAVNVFQTGYPTSRVEITNNLWRDISNWRAIYPFNPGVQKFLAINNAIDLNDAHLSLDVNGTWHMHDWLVEHNTVVSPNAFTGFFDLLGYMLAFISDNNPGGTFPTLPIKNFYFRNNVVRLANSFLVTQTGWAITSRNGAQLVTAAGSAALDVETEPSSRYVAYNAMYSPTTGNTPEEAGWTGAETNNAIVPAVENIGFANHIPTNYRDTSDVLHYVLTDLYTAGTCTVTNGSTAVTGFTLLPNTIVKGTPFKFNATGQFYLVQARVGNTTLTLQTAYAGPTATGAFTLGFKGWSSELNGTDPGIDATVLAAAIAGVVVP